MERKELTKEQKTDLLVVLGILGLVGLAAALWYNFAKPSLEFGKYEPDKRLLFSFDGVNRAFILNTKPLITKSRSFDLRAEQTVAEIVFTVSKNGKVVFEKSFELYGNDPEK